MRLLTSLLAVVIFAWPINLQAKHKKQQTPSTDQPSTIPDQEITTPYGDFRLSDLRIVQSLMGTGIAGVLHNGTSRTWSNLDFHLRLTLADGSIQDENQVDLLVGKNVAPNQDVAFAPMKLADPYVFGISLPAALPSGTKHAEFVMTDGECRFYVTYHIIWRNQRFRTR